MNKIVVWGLILLVVIVAIGYYILFVTESVSTKPIEVIPNNAALVIQIDEPGNFYSKVSDENEIWKSLAKGETTKKLVKHAALIDSIMHLDDEISKIETGQAIISLHFDTTFNEAQYLIAVEIINKESKQFLQVFNSQFTVSSSEHYKNVMTIAHDRFNFKIFAGIKNNILLLSKQDWLINKVLQPGPKGKKHFSEGKTFIDLMNTSGKNTDARIFINYKWLTIFLKNSLAPASKNVLNEFDNFAGWSETDLLIKNDELIFSGFTFPDTKNYLRDFANQKPGKIGSFRIAPFNTSMLLATNFSNIQEIVKQDELTDLNKSLNFDLSKFLSVCGTEIAFASNASNKLLVQNNSWFFIHLADISKAKQYLNQISSNTGVNKGILHNGQTIRKINYRNVVPLLFGNPYALLQNTWYAFIDQYVVFANSAESLKQLISNYESGKTLDLNDNFKQFSDNITGNSNIFLYVSPRYINGFLANYLRNETLSKINQNEGLLNDIQGLSFQFTSRDSIFYTNFYLRNDKTEMKENLDLWRLELDNEVSGKPYLVRDHSTNNFNIIVFDTESNMYLVSPDGQVLWKKKLDNIPESEIFQMDFYKNGKIQYLLNTRDFIYLLDKNGNRVENFPKKINPSATNGLSLFDYDGNKSYRIMIAQADKRVYNYTGSGNKVDGWQKPGTENIVTDPVVHLSAGGRDYIIITDINNNIKIIDRKGNQRIRLREKIEKARNSAYYINKTNSKGVILTTDKYGRLTYISTTGKLQYTEFGEYSADHFFLYEDFTGNGSKDFIYIEGNQLNVFNRFKKVLFNYQFPADISIKPVFFKLGRNQNVLGIVDKQNKTIYLFGKDGNPIISSGLIGGNPFTVGNLYNNNELHLVTSVGRTLYNYRLN